MNAPRQSARAHKSKSSKTGAQRSEGSRLKNGVKDTEEHKKPRERAGAEKREEKEMNGIKENNRAKWVIAVLLVFAMLAGMLGMLQGCSAPKEDGTGTEQTEGGAMEIEMNDKAISPVMLTAKQVITANEGIAAKSEQSFHLTATVTPLDAVNKAIEYKAEWENGGVGWASGKSVADYIEVSQFSDGSPEADVKCKQAFGVPVIVSAVVREDEGLRDSCKFNYVRKCVGSDYTMKAVWSGKTHAQWDFVHTNLNPTVDFIKLNSSYDVQDWAYGWANNLGTVGQNPGSCFESNVTAHYDNVYTKNNGDYMHYTVWVAATQTYLDTLYSIGFKTKVSAGEFVKVSDYAFSEFVLDSFVTQKYFTDYAQYSALRGRLRNTTSQNMLQIKVMQISDDTGKYVKETIYNVKFSASSVSPIAENVSLNVHEGEF